MDFCVVATCGRVVVTVEEARRAIVTLDEFVAVHGAKVPSRLGFLGGNTQFAKDELAAVGTTGTEQVSTTPTRHETGPLQQAREGARGSAWTELQLCEDGWVVAGDGAGPELAGRKSFEGWRAGDLGLDSALGAGAPGE